MCTHAIVDADVYHLVLPSRRGDGDADFMSWIGRGDGVLTYAATGKFAEEVRRNPRTQRLMQEYRQSQRARLIRTDELSTAEMALHGAKIRSNDPHVLRVALASDAVVLCTNDDALGEDFRDVEILPRVGRRRRVLYPLQADRKARGQFLGRRKCPRRGR